MNPKSNSILLLVFLILTLCHVSFSQQYDYTCYCATTGSTPDNIVQLDNNEKLLLALQTPQTLSQLKERGFTFSQSQIQLLLDWQLVREKEGIYETAFPILDSARTASLQQRMKEHARATIIEIADKISELKSALAISGRAKTVYTLLFSYVLDDLVWRQFENKKVLRPKQTTTEHPFWGGTFWAVTPRRKAFCGTNSISDKGFSLEVNWAPNAIPLMTPFVSDWKDQVKMFDEFVTNGKVTDQQAKAVFGPFGVFDSDGHPTIPVITEDPDDPMYRYCLELAGMVSKRVLHEVGEDDLGDSIGCKDKEQTLVIAYHEWMWEFLDECEADGLIAKPLAFAHPEIATSADIGDLIFLVKRQSKNR
jgi:hypothetical protein